MITMKKTETNITHLKNHIHQKNQMNQGDALSLPKGWEIKKLGEVCENLDSKRIPITQNKRKKGDIPYYGASGIVDYVSDYIFNEDLLCVSEDGANLLARTYPIAFPISGKTWVNNHAHVLRFPNLVTQKFVEIYLNSIRIDDYVSGMAQPKLNQAMLNKIKIPIPPFPEQQRIVSILDEAFSVIERSRNNAEQNLKNAKELFESYLQGVFEKKGEGWEEKRFDEVCVLQRGFDLPTHSRFEGDYPLVSSNGITDRINEWKVKAPGVVTGRSGTIGNVHFIEEDFWPLNTALYIKDFHGNDERFIYHFLTAFDLSKFSSGTGVPTLNRNNVHNVKVSIPKSKETQQTIVSHLDALRAETQKLEAVYQKKIVDLEELKKSILQKAFAGELTGNLIATE
jgi:type I restriction enzyme S subunit